MKYEDLEKMKFKLSQDELEDDQHVYFSVNGKVYSGYIPKKEKIHMRRYKVLLGVSLLGIGSVLSLIKLVTSKNVIFLMLTFLLIYVIVRLV